MTDINEMRRQIREEQITKDGVNAYWDGELNINDNPYKDEEGEIWARAFRLAEAEVIGCHDLLNKFSPMNIEETKGVCL